MTAVRGFYISSGREVLSSFRQSVALMSQEDKESYLAIFRRVLSGAQDKNLIDLSFRTSQVADSDEHRLLMRCATRVLTTRLRSKHSAKPSPARFPRRTTI